MALVQSICKLGRVHEIDFYGISAGLISFFVVFLYTCHLLHKNNINLKFIVNIVLISALGHFIGAYMLYLFAITYGADSCFYFDNAITTYQGTGYTFAFFILGLLKKYLLGSSFLGAFLIAGSLGFLGSVYYFLTYKILLDKISSQNEIYLRDKKQIIYPAILLMCWPSYFFWSAGLGKDSIVFLSIGVILYVIAQKDRTLFNLITAGMAILFATMLRPYLFLIFVASTFIYLLIGSALKIYLKITIIFLILGAAYFLIIKMNEFSVISSGSVSEVGEYAVRQQERMSAGSSMPIPTHNPYLTFLFIPYLATGNLLLPLGVGARNLIGLISSIENFFFLSWIIFFIKNRYIWKDIKLKASITQLLIIYFIIGMSFLSLISTNLGAAMREKMMYVPAFLICIFLTYTYRKMLLIEYKKQYGING